MDEVPEEERVEGSIGERLAMVWPLIAFGAPADHFDVADFTVEGRGLQIGVAPQRIDLLTSISGVRFDDAWEARETGESIPPPSGRGLGGGWWG